MDDSIGMQMLDCQDDFSYVAFSLFLLKIHLLSEQLSQISSGHVLQHEDMAGILAEGERSLDQVISCYLFEDLVLILDGDKLLLNVRVRQLYYLQSIDISGLYSSDHIDFSKGSSPQEFQNLEI